MDNDLVHNSSDESISGEKIFEQFPRIQSIGTMIPTDDDQLIHKYFYENDISNKLNDYMDNTSNQEIDGIKEFKQFPLLPFGTPIELNH
jgi:hypothetical protein